MCVCVCVYGAKRKASIFGEPLLTHPDGGTRSQGPLLQIQHWLRSRIHGQLASFCSLSRRHSVERRACETCTGSLANLRPIGKLTPPPTFWMVTGNLNGNLPPNSYYPPVLFSREDPIHQQGYLFGLLHDRLQASPFVGTSTTPGFLVPLPSPHDIRPV